MQQTEYFTYLSSPAGTLKIEADESALTAISFLFERPEEKDNPNEVCEDAAFQLKAYFDGRLKKFDLPLKQEGTDFQKRVWQKLSDIPFGKTISYSTLATWLGDPNFVRAVGAANGKNPFAIVVPCHRVVGAGGSLVGYAGGLPRKQWLLNFEGQLTSGQLEIF